MTTLNNLHRYTYNGISGRCLCLVRGYEEEKFFNFVNEIESCRLFDFTITSSFVRNYFFSNGCPEERIIEFLSIYDSFGSTLKD